MYISNQRNNEIDTIQTKEGEEAGKGGGGGGGAVNFIHRKNQHKFETQIPKI